MRIFVYEWTCCAPDAPALLRREGWAMLWALLTDFQRTREIETVTLVHHDFPHAPPGACHRVRTAAEESEWFDDLAGSADATLVIAPETAGCLLERVQRVQHLGGRLLGPSPSAIRLTTAKDELAAVWQPAGVPTPAVHPWPAPSQLSFPVVVKPRDGAGSQATFLVSDPDALARCVRLAHAETPTADLMIQDHAAGRPASVAFLLGPRGSVPLLAGTQLLSTDGRYRYEGGEMPLPPALMARAVALGQRAVAAVPELNRGYVGVDLVLDEAADGRSDCALEINPRLTTSYLGLRILCQDNLARAMLRVALGQDLGRLRWRNEYLRFHPDGRLESWPASR